MDCNVCGFIDNECNNSLLEGGYVARICDNCLNRYQADLYKNFPMEKQARFRYLQKLKELTEEQALEYVQLIHDFFFFTERWVKGMGDSPDDESDLMRLHEMWTGKNGEE